jgi:hypothetical protein
MEGVTLLESGTSRAHFALIKRLENAADASEADLIVVEAFKQARQILGGKSANATAESSLCSQLLVVLHCCSAYPHGRPATLPFVSLDCSFALVPALTLLSVAKHARGLQIAYSMIEILLGRSALSAKEELQASSLLLFNTMRLHLGSGVNTSRQASTSTVGSSLQAARISMALLSIVSGIPRGADAIPAFHGPVSNLLSHQDYGIRALAIRAMLVLQSYRDDEEDMGLARAMWIDIRRASAAMTTSKGGSKKSVEHEGLARALVLAAESAYSGGILDEDEMVDILLNTSSPEHSSKWCQLHVLKTLRRADIKTTSESRLKICQWASACAKRSDYHKPLLLESSAFIGQHATDLLSDPSTVPFLQEVWSQCISHLQAHNANRRLLAIRILHAMLACGWTEASATLQLSEDDMTRLLGGLSDYDASIRVETLRLLAEVQNGLLASHLQALKDILRSTKDIEAAEETALRAIEVVVILFATTRSVTPSAIWSTLAKDLCEISQLGLNKDTALLEFIGKAVAAVSHIDEMHDRTEAVQKMSVRLHNLEGEERLSATSVMLLATLVCQALERGADPEARGQHTSILQSMSSMLSRLPEQAALQEAWIVAMIKLAAFCAQTTVQSTLSTVTEFSKACNSQSVKQRLQQYTYMARDERTEQLSASLRPLPVSGI